MINHRLNLRAVGGAILAGALFLPAAHAGFIFTGGTTGTSYGVTDYGGGPQALPAFIANNVTTATTGRNDILATPGAGYQLANPVLANNIASYGPVPYSNYTFQIGGGNINGLFGTGFTLVTPTTIGFTLADSNAGGGSASYSITSTDATFVTDAGGFNGNIGSYLGIAGTLGANSAAVAALMTEINVDNTGWQYETALILAAAGDGNNAGSGDMIALVNTSFGLGGTYQGVAIDNWGNFTLAGAGHSIRVISTLTAISDPASIDSFLPDPGFLDSNGLTLPDFSLSSTGAGVPEPGVLILVGTGLVGFGLARRKRR